VVTAVIAVINRMVDSVKLTDTRRSAAASRVSSRSGTGTVVAGALPPRLTAETGLKAQRAEAIKWAMPYPPRMTAAMLPATTARRNAAVMVYSMEDHVRPTQQHPAPQFGEPQSRGSAQCFILPVPQRRN
jgi:hypothetical protein